MINHVIDIFTVVDFILYTGSICTYMVWALGGDVVVRAEINYISTTSWVPDDNYGT